MANMMLEAVGIIHSSEPLVTFVLVTNGKTAKDKTVRQSYVQYLGLHFGANSFLFTEGSVKVSFYCPYSGAKNGTDFLLKDGLKVSGDEVKRGAVIIPRPGGSVWSGTRYSFKTMGEFQKIVPRIEEGTKQIFFFR